MEQPFTHSGTRDPAPSPREQENAALARQAAAAGIVLLKNRGVLPLNPGAPVALFGAGAGRTVKGGTGSGDVNNRASVSIWQDLKGAKAALYVISRIAGEGKDRRLEPGDYYLSDAERADLQTLDESGLPVVLLLNAGGPVELTGLLEQAERYRELKPIHTQLNAIHRKGQREKFKAAHEGELRQFYMARRKLKDHFTPEGRLPLTKWKTEYGKLQQAYQEEYAKYKPIREDLMKLYQAKSAVDTARRQQEQAHTQRRDRDMEWRGTSHFLPGMIQ